MIEPNNQEVRNCLRDIALRELEAMPVGSVVMVDEVIGYKKMSWWWNVMNRFYGWKFRIFGL